MPIKKNTPGCIHCTCSGGGGPTGCAKYCVVITGSEDDFDITFSGSSGVLATGSTDGGSFCFSPTIKGSVTTATIVTPMGLSCTQFFSPGVDGATCTINLNYCKQTLTVYAYDGDSGDSGGGGGLPIGVITGDEHGCEDCTDSDPEKSELVFVQEYFTNTAGAILCIGGVSLPSNLTVCSPGYWANCGDMPTLTCNQELSKGIPLFSREKYIRNPCCSGCDPGTGVNYLPKKLCVTFAGAPSCFGSDEGSPITLDWDGIWDGQACSFNHHPITYTTGCLGGNGGYGICVKPDTLTCFLLGIRVVPGTDPPVIISRCSPTGFSNIDFIKYAEIPYQSHIVSLTYSGGTGTGGCTPFPGIWTAGYANFWNPGCVDTPVPVCAGTTIMGISGTDADPCRAISVPVVGTLQSGEQYCSFSDFFSGKTSCDGESDYPFPTGFVQATPKSISVAMFPTGGVLCQRPVSISGVNSSPAFGSCGTAYTCSVDECGDGGMAMFTLPGDFPESTSMMGLMDAPVAKPSLLKMATNFAGALATHILDGTSKASAEVQADRLAICQACPSYDSVKDACLECGCGSQPALVAVGLDLKLKRSWATARCPLTPPKW